MSIWARVGSFVSRVSANAFSSVIDALRHVFDADPQLRRRVAFSIAMIALSAKMAKADGVVTQDEIHAFRDIFEVPESETRNVSRLYQLAQQDVAGYEAYASQMARLCGSGEPNCAMLEDILDGLFHIAKADGYVHEREVAFLRRVSEIFEIDAAHFESMIARHTAGGAGDPHAALGVAKDAPFEEVRRTYLRLVRDNHPDKLMARGVPEEFVTIANARLAAINDAYAAIEKGRVRA